MTAPTPNADSLNQAIQRTHRSVLILLVGCGAVVWLSAAADAYETTPRVYAWAATALGGLAILTRPFRSVRIKNPKLVVAKIVISLVAAAGVGLVGVMSAVMGGPRTTALAYVLAGAIFALRPPARIHLPGTAGAPEPV
jgi:hypothetical protein